MNGSRARAVGILGSIHPWRNQGGGRARVVFGFTITRGKIAEIDLVADPERLRQVDLVVLDA